MPIKLQIAQALEERRGSTLFVLRRESDAALSDVEGMRKLAARDREKRVDVVVVAVAVLVGAVGAPLPVN